MDSQEAIVNDLVEVTFPEKDDFLKIRETLSRIGVASRREQELYQSCHILHKRGKYYLVHFKELFALDGKDSSITESDLGRRNAISKLLQEWGLLKVISNNIESPMAPMSLIKVLPYKDKEEWELVPKYNSGVVNK